MLSLNTVMINSEDPAALSAFYRKVLGEPGWDDGGYVGWQVGSGSLMIGPHSEVKGQNEMPGRIMINFETPDVKGEFDRVKALGAKVPAAAVAARRLTRRRPARPWVRSAGRSAVAVAGRRPAAVLAVRPSVAVLAERPSAAVA
jgi:predicted enzyme related to lactoylglutathione lyase